MQGALVKSGIAESESQRTQQSRAHKLKAAKARCEIVCILVERQGKARLKEFLLSDQFTFRRNMRMIRCVEYEGNSHVSDMNPDQSNT